MHSRKFAPNTCGWHHADAGQALSDEGQQEMSIFPTTILLATDGSREAELAGQSAADLAQKTDSELHVLHVLALPLDTHDPSSFEPEVWGRLEKRARTILEDQVGRIEASGGEVEGSHFTTGRPDAEVV